MKCRLRNPPLAQPVFALAGEQTISQQITQHREAGRLFVVGGRTVLQHPPCMIRMSDEHEKPGKDAESHDVTHLAESLHEQLERIMPETL